MLTTGGTPSVAPLLLGDLVSSSARSGVTAPGDLGSGNSASSMTGVTPFGARSLAATASGAENSIGRSSCGATSSSDAFFFLGMLLQPHDIKISFPPSPLE